MIRYIAIAALSAALSAGAAVPVSAQSGNPGFGTCFGLMFSNPAEQVAQCGTFRGDSEPPSDAIMGDGDGSDCKYSSLLRDLEYGERIHVATAGPCDV
ncbi:MAG: hypothetical protein ACO1OK_02435 [Devosia sp.]